MSLACDMIPIKRIESLRPDLRFRVPLGDGAHELEVLRYKSGITVNVDYTISVAPKSFSTNLRVGEFYELRLYGVLGSSVGKYRTNSPLRFIAMRLNSS